MTITRKEIEDGMILFCKSGSHAYGLNTEMSDLDFKGICVAPQRFYTTLETFEQKDKGWAGEQQDEGEFNSRFPELDNSDSVVYGIRRYLSLLRSQNPNILEMLWQTPDSYLHLNFLGQSLIDNRKKLISKRISGTFVQYARSQIKKMETHRKWLLNPPTRRPEWEDYGVSSPSLTPSQIESFIEYLYLLIKDRIEYYQPSVELYELLNDRLDWKGVLKQSVLPEECFDETQKITRASDEYMALLHSSQQYRSDLKRWSNYQDWLTNRKTGELLVNRKLAGDADFLLDIKYGRITYDELSSIVTQLFKEAEHVVKNECVLPNTVDDLLINTLCAETVEKFQSLGCNENR